MFLHPEYDGYRLDERFLRGQIYLWSTSAPTYRSDCFDALNEIYLTRLPFSRDRVMLNSMHHLIVLFYFYLVPHLLYSALFCSIVLYCTLFRSIPLYCTLL